MPNAFNFQQVVDKNLLRKVLQRDAISSMYLLGDLEEPFFNQCRWFVGFYHDRPLAVVMVFEGLSVPAILTFGAPDLIEGILVSCKAILPTGCYVKLLEGHLPVFSRHFQILSSKTMWSMGLTKDEYVPLETTLDIRRITREVPVESILKLYED